MSAERHRFVWMHAKGLLLTAAYIAALVVLWIYGLPMLEGTPFQELSLLVYLVCATAFLAFAERLAHRIL